MKNLALVMVVASSAGCMTPVMQFGGPNRSQAQHATAAQYTPPALAVDDEAPHEHAVKTARVHVWADDDYRAQNVHWEKAFQESLDYANEVLAAQFGVQLVPEFHSWSYHDQAAPLGTALTALEREDPGGADVFAVIGLTSALGLVSASFDQIGIGELPGRYLVVRGYDGALEKEQFERAFTELSPAEREAMYDARRRHKNAALLLHELGHNLGAKHRVETDTLMSPSYSVKSASFDRASRDILAAEVDARLHRAPRHDATTVAVPAPGHAQLMIDLGADGRPRSGGAAIDDDTLDGLLKLTFEDDGETEVVIRFARGAAAGAIAKLADRARAAGFKHVTTAPR